MTSSHLPCGNENAIYESALRRALPQVYLVDRNGEPQVFNDPAARAPLSPELALTVRELLRREDRPHRTFIAPTGSHVVSLTPLHGELGASLFLVLVSAIGGRNPRVDLSRYGLTKRESAVVDLLARGHETRSIAEALRVTTATVQQHIKSAMAKTNAHTRVGLVLAATGQTSVHAGHAVMDDPHGVHRLELSRAS